MRSREVFSHIRAANANGPMPWRDGVHLKPDPGFTGNRSQTNTTCWLPVAARWAFCGSEESGLLLLVEYGIQELDTGSLFFLSAGLDII